MSGVDSLSCVVIGLLAAINSLQAMGDVTATTMGGMDREATDKELRGGILGFGLSNIIGAFFGGLPNVAFSQNAGIVTATKIVNRCMPVGSDWRTAVLNSEHLVSVCLIFVHLTERLLGDLLVFGRPVVSVDDPVNHISHDSCSHHVDNRVLF